MTELLPKPRREDFTEAASSMESALARAAWIEVKLLESELAYYKRLAEFAIEALERIAAVSDDDAAMRATNALSTIKGSQS